MVLTGYINKNITINLCKKNILMLWGSGTDGKLIEAKKYVFYKNSKKVDLGFVGKPTKTKYKTNKGIAFFWHSSN